MGLAHPEIFGRLAVLSPSVWWNHRYILAYLNDVAPGLHQRPRIWLDAGDQEGRRTLADVDMLHARLRKQGWRDNVDLHFETIAGGKHDEASWAERVRPMLRFLFPAQRKPRSPRVGASGIVMNDTPIDLIRKLDETATALRGLAHHVRAAAVTVADPALRDEMLESAAGWERRAAEMSEAILRWKREIN